MLPMLQNVNRYLSCSVFLIFNIETAKHPVLLSSPRIGENGLTATLMWNHTDQGPCFTNPTFSYNITWYPVVGGVPLRGEGQSAVTGPGATAYTITNLMNGTDNQVELVGFTSSDPVVYSEVATVLVIFTAEGVYMCHIYATVHRSCCHSNGHLKDDSTSL